MNPSLRALFAPLLIMICTTTACSSLPMGSSKTPPGAVTGPVRSLACETLDALRSVDSVGRITLMFHNHTAEPLSLSWINYDGEEESFADIAVDARAPVNTYFTHPWVLRGQKGTCVAAFVSDDTAAIHVGSKRSHP